MVRNLLLAVARSRAGLLGVVVGLVASSPALGQTDIAVPNHSFEQLPTTFAWPDAESWVETGPVGEDPQLPGVVDTLDTGVFFNSPVDGGGGPSPFFISNADGTQLGFIGALDNVDIAFFQQLTETFQAGASYTLTIDVGESFFFPPLTFNPNDPNPPPNPPAALLAVRLYYEDASLQKITVAERLVSTDELPQGVDAGLLLATFSASTALSVSTDPFIGKQIGIEIRPSLGLSGVWNVENVRLSTSLTIPAASTWGLIAMMLMLASAGTVLVRRNADREMLLATRA